MTERRLIVNADDFGRSHGINRGVFVAHERGIVTSASLMARWPAARDAVVYARDHSDLALGLHLDFGEWRYADGEWVIAYEVVDVDDPAAVRAEVWRQIERFDQLRGAYPTHLDSHQHLHRNEPALSVVADVGRELGVPVREGDPGIRYCGDFHGQSGRGEAVPGAIAVDALVAIVESLPPGTTELACHPGIGDESGSVYGAERETEVETLCDPAVRAALVRAGVTLTSFAALAPPGICAQNGPA